MKKKVLLLIICLVLLLAGLIAIFWNPIIDWLPIDQSRWSKLKSGEICYLDEDGDPIFGWQEIESNIYYFDIDTYAMQTGWVDLPDGRYYLGDDGIRRTDWQTIDGKRYYLGDNGAMFTGWLETEDGMLYLSEQGNPSSGWVELEDGKYYLDENSIRQTGWLELEGQRHYLGEDGRLHTGWLELEEGKYYLSEEGTPLTGWQNVEDNVYYLDETGIMQTGWLELDGKKYYLCGDGSRYTGWLEMGECNYYLQEDGSAAIGKLVIDERAHYFAETGAEILLVNAWNALPDDYEPELTTMPPGLSGYVSPLCYDALEQMIADCTAAGCRPDLIGGYRNIGSQRVLFNNIYAEYKAKGYSDAWSRTLKRCAKPGTSEHHLGLAFDIVDKRYSQKYTGENNAVEWIAKNGAKYGFILRYPADKTDITGIMSEPWHFRYVGVELAEIISASGLCLEEYLDQLTNDGTTCGNPDAVKPAATE